ncbi:unnamed protein product [Chilo suppressalis]|uniref:C2H2-type domain-containing protein n=1 Tax=Chilo suppressalis TaxID=168631 RepID=A0ABN8B4A1_CHISP|nr:unnamed protein product [Chilo suppressalis]
MEEYEALEILDPDTTCTLCYAEFLDPEDLYIHINQVHSTEQVGSIVNCQFCAYFCSDIESYAVHLRDAHLTDLKCCKYCTRVFDDSSAHKRHEIKHYIYVNKSAYSCSHCKDVFTTLSELRDHDRLNHSDSAEGALLNEVFPVLSSLLNANAKKFLQSLNDVDVLYVCLKCDHTTPKITDFIEHLKLKGCRSLSCDGCSSVYKTKKGLYKHYNAHPECFNGVSTVKQCSECLKEYDIKTLREHSRTCKPIKCKKCNIVFNSMYELTKHQTETHPAIVLLQQCQYCNKDFAGQAAMEKHIERVHKSNLHLYKYRCVYCDVVFKHPKKLFGHFFSTHKDLEPYTCKICDKKFRIRRNFTLHIKLDHKSIGYVEFDDKYHVYFSETKSERPVKQSTETGGEQNKIKDGTALNKKSGELEETEQNNEIDSKQQSSQSSNRVRFNVEDNEKNISFPDINSDFMSATETEGNQTEGDIEKSTSLKRKLKTKKNINKRRWPQTLDEIVITDSSSDEDESLLVLKKRVAKQHKTRLAKAKRAMNNALSSQVIKKSGKKNKLVCDVCKKPCYTYQNYNNHIASHRKNATVKCVKCSETFKTRKALNDHYSKEHSSSQLTETLKNLLEKRKSLASTKAVLSVKNEKFKLTIKKVCTQSDSVPATVVAVGDTPLSVRKFIESFVPETDAPKKDINIDTNITIKKVYGSRWSVPKIKMTKCNLDHQHFQNGTKLAMPVPFKKTQNEQHKVTVKAVETPICESPEHTSTVSVHQDYPDQDDYHEDDNDEQTIPEVAQEVMLEGSEDPTPKTIYIPHKVVIPKLAPQCKKIHIAHLQPEAPYYKIVKVEDALNPKKKPEAVSVPKKDIKLPDGTTLVSVNPLAHLLGDTPVEKIIESTKNKHYTPKPKDFASAVAKAMLKLAKTSEASAPKRRRKAKESK